MAVSLRAIGCALTFSAMLHAADTVIHVQADQVLHSNQQLLVGTCLEDINHSIYGGLYSQMIFGESFQEQSLSPLFKDFTIWGGRWEARDGALELETPDGVLLSGHPGFMDGAVSVEMYLNADPGGGAGLLLHGETPIKDPDNIMGYAVTLNPSEQTLHIVIHRQSRGQVRLPDVKCDVPKGRWFPLEARTTGSILEVLVDGKSVCSLDLGTNALPSGNAGLWAENRPVKYRNMMVSSGGRQENLPFVQTEWLPQLSSMWSPVSTGSATGEYQIVTDQPFVGTQSQKVTFVSGEGVVGMENQGLNRWGMNFVAGKPYEGCVWVKAGQPATLSAELESRDGSQVYAAQELKVGAGDWQKLSFTLTPNAKDAAGRFALELTQPGSVTFGYVFLQPGEWGRFKGLPVRKDIAEAMINQGIKVLRYGGSMTQMDHYRWKFMVGPRDKRQPYHGFWYRYSTHGWAIPDFMNFAEAAGFDYVPDFNLDETPQDMADFIEYAKGPPDSKWGAQRVADGHPAPYLLKYMELGNECHINPSYFARFKPMAEAIWAKDPDVILVVGDDSYSKHISDPYNFEGGRTTTLAVHKQILDLAKAHNREVWFDVHVGTDKPMLFNPEMDGMLSYYDALDKLANGAKHKVVVLECNGGNPAINHALADAIVVQMIQRDGRLPIVTPTCCLQPDGQNDNGANSGLLFFNTARTWLQPPGYAMQMNAENDEPDVVASDATGGLDVIAKRSSDGRTLQIQVVNPGNVPLTTELDIAGFTPSFAEAKVIELSGLPKAYNTGQYPHAVVPKTETWQHGLDNGKTTYTFPPCSFTIIRFD